MHIHPLKRSGCNHLKENKCFTERILYVDTDAHCFQRNYHTSFIPFYATRIFESHQNNTKCTCFFHWIFEFTKKVKPCHFKRLLWFFHLNDFFALMPKAWNELSEGKHARETPAEGCCMHISQILLLPAAFRCFRKPEENLAFPLSNYHGIAAEGCYMQDWKLKIADDDLKSSLLVPE